MEAWQRMKEAKVWSTQLDRYDGSIDLHGMPSATAWVAVLDFMTSFVTRSVCLSVCLSVRIHLYADILF